MFGHETLSGYLSGYPRIEAHRPWPRYRLGEPAWRTLVEHLAVEDWVLLGLWGDGTEVHAALRDEENADIAVVSLDCPRRRFPSLARIRPGALRLERAIHDLYGLTPVDCPDQRPWLDHGRWTSRHPLGAHHPPAPEPYSYNFLTAEGAGLHQIPVGPVHAGIIEPGHFRFHCAGEAVVRLEERLGYVHKGTEGLMTGRTLAEAARLAGRVSGDSTVAYALAFARAAEAALDIEVPARAHWLRALMAELERIANHVFDFGAVCNDAAYAIMLAECTT
ncbi:MAG: NADH-quinone oxidoreductase subunit C, partial [Rhodospirillales bacterium]|nr:NADH-quinone oxidoreductase subunit C [Rhodospirillales bacterium]